MRETRKRTAARSLGAGLVAGAALLPWVAAGAGEPRPTRIEVAEQRLARLSADLVEASGRLAATQRRLEVLGAEMGAGQRGVRRLVARLVEGRDEARDLARSLYMNGSSGGLETLFESDSVSEAGIQLEYLRSSQESTNEMLRDLARDRLELAGRLDRLDRQRTEAAVVMERIDSLHVSLERRVASQKAEVVELQAEARARREAAQRRRTAALAQRLEAARKAAERARAQAAEVVVVAATIVSPVPPGPAAGVDWDAIAACESGGNWALDGRYDGGLQFHPDTWLGAGGARYARFAYQATRAQQIAVAEVVLDTQGPSAWPNCFDRG